MLRIIDATLTMMEELQLTATQIKRFINIVKELSITAIAITPKIYEILDGNLIDGIVYYMEMPLLQETDTDQYQGIQYFISNAGTGKGNSIKNIQINDLMDINRLEEVEQDVSLRVTGLDSLLISDNERMYQRIMKELKSRNVIFYPENSYYCATAIAADYIQYHNKGTIMTTFLGIHNKAATEQVLLALRVVERYKPNASFEKISQLRNLYEEMTGKKVSEHAPVVGREIFYVESGVHVDGIMKKTANYEAYSPELVGAKREIVLGKHSGGASIKYKLTELGYRQMPDIEVVLEQVKRAGIKRSRALTDAEFMEIVDKELANEEKVKIS